MKKRHVASHTRFSVSDFSQWNFVIFLTLALMLLVAVLFSMNKLSFELRAKALGVCVTPTLPQSPCQDGEWKYKPDTNGCYTFFCEAQ